MDATIHHGTDKKEKLVVYNVVFFQGHVNMPQRGIPTMVWANAEMDVIIHHGTNSSEKPVA
jgi:hypothetical protein